MSFCLYKQLGVSKDKAERTLKELNKSKNLERSREE